jgi:hypothetical protein
MKTRPMGAELFHERHIDRQTDRQTDGRRGTTKLIVPFRNFAKELKNNFRIMQST